MCLLSDIQEAAIDSQVSLTDLLRKCLVLAARLKSPELRQWVEWELEGYPEGESLPSYRIIPGHAFGLMIGTFGRYDKRSPLSPSVLPKKFQEWARCAYLSPSIATFMAVEPGQAMTCPWPADLLPLVNKYATEGWYCHSAWLEIPPGAVHALVDAVRTRILKFVLTVSEELPGLGGESASVESIPPERVTQLFQTIVMGDVGNVAVGSPSAHQTQVNIGEGDIDQLREELVALGISTGDITELVDSLEADDTKNEIGPRTAAWIGKMVSKASSGALKHAPGVVSGILINAISKYLGL